MGRILFKALVFCTTAMLALATPAAAVQVEAASSEQDCARVTLVSTQSEEARADVYVSEWEHGIFPHDLNDIKLVQWAREQLQAAPRANETEVGGKELSVQIEVVVPKNDALGTPGKRLTIELDLNACVGP